MRRARLTWLDDTTITIREDEATIEVRDSGLIVARRGNRTTYIPATSYKQLDIEDAP